VPATEQAANSPRAIEDVAVRALAAGLRRVHVFAWRDIEDPEAGGSELHAHLIAQRWAAAGLEVAVRTSRPPGQLRYRARDGYLVVRKSGRYMVFARSAVSGALGRNGRPDGLVEIWNGMPFFSPLWARCPRIVFLHHVHAEMWQTVLPPTLARLGSFLEQRVAPPFYRRSRIVTLSDSSREEIVDLLGMPADNVRVVPPGVGPSFQPGGQRCRSPLVVAVGRLVPIKRFDLLIDALVRVKKDHPGLEAVIVGEGFEGPRLSAMVRSLGASDWISLPGRLSEEELLDLYRRAWVLAATSLREGWGMTVTEAAACGTPAVATRIAGHSDAIVDGVTGLLVSDTAGDIAGALTQLLSQRTRRERMGKAALARASGLTWDRTATGTLEALVEEAERRA